MPYPLSSSRSSNCLLTSSYRHGVKAELDRSPAVLKAIQDSIDFLDERLRKGEMVYGMSISFSKPFSI